MYERMGLLLAPLLLMAASPGPSVAAAVPRGCDVAIDDQAGAVPHGLADVESEAAAVGNGALVHVTIVNHVPSADLAAYETRRERACGWTDGRGARDPKLVAVVVDTDDGVVGFFPGWLPLPC